jgi:hypothetical protein
MLPHFDLLYFIAAGSNVRVSDTRGVRLCLTRGRTAGERATGPEAPGGRGVRYPRPVGKIGRVEELFVGGEGEPEYVGVRMGPFGLKSVLIR